MKLLISPAKKMRAEDFLPPRTQPPLLEKSAQLLDYVRGISLPQLKRLLACNESLAQEAFENFRAMELGRGTTPALLAYDGIQYKYMAPGVFTQAQLEYVGSTCASCRGFTACCAPSTGVVPLPPGDAGQSEGALLQKPLRLLGGLPGEFLLQEDSVLVNLASEEYAKGRAPGGGGEGAVYHLYLRRGAGARQAGGKGRLRQDGPWGDGALCRGAQRPIPRGLAGLFPPGLRLRPPALHRGHLPLLPQRPAQAP